MGINLTGLVLGAGGAEEKQQHPKEQISLQRVPSALQQRGRDTKDTQPMVS